MKSCSCSCSCSCCGPDTHTTVVQNVGRRRPFTILLLFVWTFLHTRIDEFAVIVVGRGKQKPLGLLDEGRKEFHVCDSNLCHRCLGLDRTLFGGVPFPSFSKKIVLIFVRLVILTEKFSLNFLFSFCPIV